MMTFAARVAAFADEYAKWPASHFRLVEEGGRAVYYALWRTGNDYRNRTAYYGAYPPGYLDRVMALFPDYRQPERREHVLHLFSGSLPASDHYVRCDAVQPSELQTTALDLPGCAWPEDWDCPRLVIADPPYSAEDAKRYGFPQPNRGRVLAALAEMTEPGAYVVWLDTVWPMHRKREWRTVALVTLVRSTNHRARLATIFERQG